MYFELCFPAQACFAGHYTAAAAAAAAAVRVDSGVRVRTYVHDVDSKSKHNAFKRRKEKSFIAFSSRPYSSHDISIH